jgi:hypothetical protein
MNQSDLQVQLRKQLGFIERSSNAFDNGFKDEAVRIATAIRILIYQEGRGDSLLSLLGVRQSLKLNSSIEQKGLKEASFFDGVSILSLDGAQPNLATFQTKSVLVETWWNEIAIISKTDMVHTRKSIVLDAVHKDGGAHVDPKLSPKYERLQQGLYSFATNSREVEEVLDCQFVALRVFAHELLNSPELIALAS